MDRNLTRVRVLSTAASAALAAGVLLACALYRVNANIDEGPPAVAIPAFVENPHQAATEAPPPRPPQLGVPSAAAVAPGEHDNSLRLWRYGENNEIVFAYAEQFDRCSEARRKHTDEADCPSSRETRTYVLAQSAGAPLVLAYRRH